MIESFDFEAQKVFSPIIWPKFLLEGRNFSNLGVHTHFLHFFFLIYGSLKNARNLLFSPPSHLKITNLAAQFGQK